MTKESMENYKIDMLRVFPGVVKEELVRPVKKDRKGVERAKKAYNLMMDAHTRNLIAKTSEKVAEERVDEAVEWVSDTNEDMPEPVPYPDQIVTLKNTNLYEALKYVRPGHFLIPSETVPSSITKLPNGRIPSFDVIPVNQAKLTIVNIARFAFLPNNPKQHIIHNMETIWTHFLKSNQVTCQLSFRPRSQEKGFNFDWMWENCVHLRPEVMQRALPSTSRLALGPLTNGNEITWLVVPRENPVDYRARWKARQQEQKNLLDAGRGMLPLEERRLVKKELRCQMRTGKRDPNSALMFSPMAMSVARLGIERRIDDLLFKYEKLYGNIRSYIGTRYGTGRSMGRNERSVVNKIVRMESVDLLKYTPQPYIPERNLRFAQLNAATGKSYFTYKRGRRKEEHDSSSVEPRGYDPMTKDNFKREARERAFVERLTSAKREDELVEDGSHPQEIHWQSDSRSEVGRSNPELAHKEQFAIAKHDEEGKKRSYEKKRGEVAAEDKIETLKKEAQEDWGEEDLLSSLSSHEMVRANTQSTGLRRPPDVLPDVLRHETSQRTGLLPYISKFEIADRVELPIRKHNSDKAPSPIRADDQISKSKSTKYPIQNSGHKAKPFNFQSNYRMPDTPRNEYGSPDKEYRNGPRDNIASELPREPQNDYYRGQENERRSDSSSAGTRYHNKTSKSHNSKIEPFQPISGIGSDIVLERQFKPNTTKRPSSLVKPRPSRKKSKSAPEKKPPKKKVVDDFGYNQKGSKKVLNSEKHLLLRAFKMDYAVAGKR